MVVVGGGDCTCCYIALVPVFAVVHAEATLVADAVHTVVHYTSI